MALLCIHVTQEPSDGRSCSRQVQKCVRRIGDQHGDDNSTSKETRIRVTRPTQASRSLPADVAAWIDSHFAGEDAAIARYALECAVDHTGALVGDRLLRCAAVGSRGRLDALLGLIDELRVDYRGVIMAGEYVLMDRTPVRVRDLTQPIDPANC